MKHSVVSPVVANKFEDINKGIILIGFCFLKHELKSKFECRLEIDSSNVLLELSVTNTALQEAFNKLGAEKEIDCLQIAELPNEFKEVLSSINLEVKSSSKLAPEELLAAVSHDNFCFLSTVQNNNSCLNGTRSSAKFGVTDIGPMVIFAPRISLSDICNFIGSKISNNITAKLFKDCSFSEGADGKLAIFTEAKIKENSSLNLAPNEPEVKSSKCALSGRHPSLKRLLEAERIKHNAAGIQKSSSKGTASSIEAHSEAGEPNKKLRLMANCAPGEAYNPETELCFSCEEGKYFSRDSKGCTECGKGHAYNSEEEVCYPCPAGTYSNLDRTGCDGCPIGTYNGDTGKDSAESCQLCPVQYYNNETGKAECPLCPDAMYTDEEGSTSCKNCSRLCSRCYATTNNDCTVCRIGVLKIAEIMGTRCACEPGYFDDPLIDNATDLPNICQPCDDFCRDCYHTKDNCLNCINNQGVARVDNECLCINPGYFLYNNPENGKKECLRCHPLCTSCNGTGKNQCIRCNEEINALLIAPNTCGCPSHQYFNSSLETCEPCDILCEECSGPTAKNCSSCKALVALPTIGEPTWCASDCESLGNYYRYGSSCRSKFCLMRRVP